MEPAYTTPFATTGSNSACPRGCAVQTGWQWLPLHDLGKARSLPSAADTYTWSSPTADEVGIAYTCPAHCWSPVCASSAYTVPWSPVTYTTPSTMLGLFSRPYGVRKIQSGSHGVVQLVGNA